MEVKTYAFLTLALELHVPGALPSREKPPEPNG
jgi:hypothetical protein